MKKLLLMISLIFTVCITKASDFPEMEVPAHYTSAEIRDRARLQNFESREAFERVVNAKINMRLNYLNLLPHLSFGAILGGATYSGILSLVSSVGDLAPFLFPTRWYRAREARYIYKAQLLAQEAMKLDAMQIVEGLTMAVGRDTELHQQLKLDQQLAKEIIKEIAILETNEKLPMGSSMPVKSVENALKQIISSLESTIALENTQLASGAGFTNPAAILSVKVNPLGNIARPEALVLEGIQKRVIENSIELEQMNEIARVAVMQKRSRLFQWLDPSGDAQGGLGLGLPFYFAVGASNGRLIEIARDRLVSEVLKKAVDGYNNYGGWIDSYSLAVEGAAIQTDRIALARKRIQGSMTPYAIEYSIQELNDALVQLSLNHINVVSAHYAWYSTISQLNRMLLKCAYQRTSQPIAH